jgi:hypothetical protein
MLNKEKNIRPDIQGEMEELQRVSQDLKRDDDIDISVEKIVDAFKNSTQEILSNDIWVNLENTESNEIEKGDWDSVMGVSKRYNKTNPKKLKKVIESDTYERPLILKLGDRHILVAGNTRLCTAAAMGINPKVFIAQINVNGDINEKWSKKYKRSIDCNNPKGFSQRAHCQGRKKIETKEMTGADSAGAFSGPLMGKVIKKKEIYKIPNFDLNEEEEFKEATDASSMGSYDVPLFGKSPKGNKDPLKISGPNSIYKGRAVKDKKFPRFGGPEGIYVKVKEKCKKFPYCNQGNTGAIEFISEDEEIRDAIQTTSKKYGIPLKEVEKLVLNQIKQIFI